MLVYGLIPVLLALPQTASSEWKRTSFSRDQRAPHVIEMLDIGAGSVVADIGCGSGWLSRAVADAVGPDGRLYAVDITPKVEDLASRARPQLIPVHSEPEDVKLDGKRLDAAFLHDVASHVSPQHRPAFYASIGRALEPDGVLVIFGAHGKADEHLAEFAKYRFFPERPEQLQGLLGNDLNARYWAGIRFRFRPLRVGPI